MAQYPRVREQHIAVFGESGSGKTVLVSSFFGPPQEGSYNNGLWDLVADDIGQGTRLYQNYLGMRDRSAAPPATRFASTTYFFSVKLKGGAARASKKQPFDIVRLGWHDYPGEWFEETPSSAQEATRRVDTFRSLLGSDVALILVDGQKLRDYEDEEERYLKSLLTNFRQSLLRLRDELLSDQGPLIEFPRIWILALSKADLFPDWDVDTFRDLVIGQAGDHLSDLRDTIRDLVEAPEALSLGEDFMLLSSAKFELATSSAAPAEIDVTRRVGLDLILPIASLLPLERRVQWSERMEVPRKVLDSLADGAEALAVALTGRGLVRIEQALARLPRVGPLANKAALPVVIAAVKMAAPQLKSLNETARANHDYLTATLTQFRLDLEKGVSDRLLLKAK